jgi:hypothetical protein
MVILLISQALAVDGGVSVALGTMAVTDPDWRVFSDDTALPSRGLRGDLDFGDHFAVVGEWQHGGRGARVDDGYIAAYRADEFALGARYGLPHKDWLVGYGTLSALGVRSEVRLDAHADDDLHDPSQTHQGSFTPGVLAMIGGDVRIPQNSAPFTFDAFLEFGYSVVAPVDLGAVGNLQIGGFAARGGAGIRF